MFAVLLDFNGTMFFDASLHMEAWSKIYQELHPEDTAPPDTAAFCGPRNDEILKRMAPWLTDRQRDAYSGKKEALYRRACGENPEAVHLVCGTEQFLQYLQENGIPFGLASASIRENIDFFFDTFALGRWFRKEDVVYDDGSYPNKGAMHLEAARRLGVPFENCMVMEDSLSSIRQAKENGAGCIVAVGKTASEALFLQSGADHHISDFSEFDPVWLSQK
ncbi:MAG: HAD family phosphatase [Oscillospiraceae bacterium]|nr:HAD family phosphatase [Oscillospiraceae bacterium]